LKIPIKYSLEKHYLIYLFGKIISAGAIVGTIPVFINLFGIEVYGRFVFLFTTFLMLSSGASGWVNQGILRFFTTEKNKTRIIKEVNQMSFNSFVLASIILSLVFYFYKANFIIILLGIFSLYFSINYSVNLTIKQALIESKRFVKADILRALGYIFIPVLFHFLIPECNPLYILFLGVLFSYLLGFLYLTNFNLSFPVLNFKKSRWNLIFLKYGIPLSIWLVFSPTTNGVDRYIIEFSLGSIALAKYASIFDIVFKIFSNLSVPFNNSLQPLLIKYYNQNNFSDYKRTMYKAITYLTLFFVIFLIGVLFTKKYVICNYLEFCEDFNSLEKLFFPLVLSSYLWQLSVLIQKNMEISNRTIEMTIYMLITVSFIVIAGIFLVPEMGLIASAYISMVGALIYLVLVIRGTIIHFKI
jgi:O-antigen/teichoic acid export membrane protein